MKKVKGAIRKCDIPSHSRILRLYESKAEDLADHIFAIFETESVNKCDFRKIEFVQNEIIQDGSFYLRFVQIKEMMDPRKRKSDYKPDPARTTVKELPSKDDRIVKCKHLVLKD